MKPFIQCLILMCISPYLHAQYTITGRVTDEHDSDVAFANVLLLDGKDSSMVKGAVADQNGNFVLTYNSSGEFFVQSYMVGFAKSYSETIHLRSEPKINIPDIILLESTQQLDEVVVKAQKPLYEMEEGKMVVNVSSSITAAGQSVIDVLEKSPGITVNRQNMRLSLNGKNGVVVVINGRRNRMPMDAVFQLLEGLNAGDIERIEIMSIPPAKYDADGDAGFINIVTEKVSDKGASGSFMANLGYGTGPRGGGSINISHNTSKLGIYGSYAFNRIHANHLGEFYREYESRLSKSTAETYFDRDIMRQVQNFQIGVDFYATKKTIISGLISGYANIFTYKDGVSQSIYTYTDAPDTLVNVTFSGNSNWRHLMGNFNLQHSLANNHVLNLNVDYLTYDNTYPSTYENRMLNDKGDEIKTINREILKKTPIHFWVGKLDYSFVLGKHITWDSGVKGTFSELYNDILAEDHLLDELQVNSNFSNESTLDEDILAAYTNIQSQIGENTTLKAGLRYEYTSTILSSDVPDENVTRKYGNFFPSLFCAYELDDDQTFQLAYGRRITRPTFNDMAPYIVFVDPNTYFSGNPTILPTLTNSLSAGYSFKSFAYSMQYSIDQNAIYKWQPTSGPESRVLLYQPKNVDLRKTLSTNLTLPFFITDWWEMQNNLTFIFQHLEGTEEGENLDQRQHIAQIITTQTFLLPKDYTIELTGIYNSPTVNGYVSNPSNGSLNIGIQKTLRNDGTFRFSCNDILETTMWQATAAFDNGFSMDSWYKPDKRIFTISYSQSLGNKKAKGARKRSVGSEEELKRVTN